MFTHPYHTLTHVATRCHRIRGSSSAEIIRNILGAIEGKITENFQNITPHRNIEHSPLTASLFKTVGLKFIATIHMTPAYIVICESRRNRL